MIQRDVLRLAGGRISGAWLPRTFLVSALVLAGVLSLAPQGVRAVLADSPSGELKVGAFVDTYYAFDFSRPPAFDRAFTTQPARHNEFNINLAFIEAVLSRESARGRLALQAGTSVQANYADEPEIGAISGGELSRHIQEAYAGFRLAESLWLDAGIFFSHIGIESFISDENWTYSRSLVSDLSPYYQTGAKLSWDISPDWFAQLQVLNGWQNVSASSSRKAVGLQLKTDLSPSVSLAYNHFSGWEPLYRAFHDLVFLWEIDESWSFGAALDFGHQLRSAASGWDAWAGGVLLSQYRASGTLAFGGRLEAFSDPKEVIASAPGGDGFLMFGGSLNVDVRPGGPVLWRSELRLRASNREIFPGAGGVQQVNPVLVTSLSLRL